MIYNLSRTLVGAFIAIGFVWFFLGMGKFPDAPIRRCGLSYCGKQGQPHSKIDFERFSLWETGLEFGWPLVIAGGWWLNRRR